MESDKVLQSVDGNEVVDWAGEMVRRSTVNPPGDELELARYIAGRLWKSGLESEVRGFERTRANLVCRLAGTGSRPPVVLCGHLDTVPIGEEPWTHDPFGGEIAEGRLYGRGAADMKGGVASMIGAFLTLHREKVPLEGDLILALTAGEEVDSRGAQKLLEKGGLSGAQGVIIAEPTGLDVSIAEKGALWLEVVTQGRAAHGSMPQTGKNAILPMMEFVKRVAELDFSGDAHPLLGSGTMNVATIRGGIKTNMVPDNCSLTVDIRTVPGQNHGSIYAELSKILHEIKENAEIEADIKVINNKVPVSTPPSDPFIEGFTAAAGNVLGRTLTPIGSPYYTDGAVLAPGLNAPMVICGPGEAACAHQANEWVSVENLVTAARIYVLAAMNALCP